MDRKKIDQFWKKRLTIKDSRVSSHFRHDDTHLYDLKIIQTLITPQSKILDLASGPCFYANKLIDKVSYIKAVDKFPEYLQHCKHISHLETVACDLFDFVDKKKYDVVLLMGIMHFFDEKDRIKIYKKCRSLLKMHGVLYLRHKCGTKEDIVIDAYSEKIGDHYYAKYLHLEKERGILEQFFQVEIIDIYPQRLNPWPNTRYYAFICRKK